MRCDTKPHQLYGGIDLQARTMDVCLLTQDGEMLGHRTMKASPATFLQAVAPSRDALVVAVECLFTWYGLADLCAQAGIPFVLGHALYMNALPGGKAKHDKIDAHKSAGLLRGGLLPPAYGSPAERRATRDWLRRRLPRLRTRAELLAHLHNTHRPYNLPEIGKQMASQAHGDGGPSGCPIPPCRKAWRWTSR